MSRVTAFLAGLSLALPVAIASAADFNVGPTGDYPTVMDAIDAAVAMPGELHTIRLARGVYHQVIRIEEPLDVALTGGWDDTFREQVDNPEATALDVSNACILVGIWAGSLRLENLTLRNGWAWGCHTGGAISAWANEEPVTLEVENVIIEGSGGDRNQPSVFLHSRGEPLVAAFRRLVYRNNSGFHILAGATFGDPDLDPDDRVPEWVGSGSIELLIENSLFHDNEGVGLAFGVREYGSIDAAIIHSTITRNNVTMATGTCGHLTAGIAATQFCGVNCDPEALQSFNLRIVNSIVWGNQVISDAACRFLPEYEQPADLLMNLMEPDDASIEIHHSNIGEWYQVSGNPPVEVANLSVDPSFFGPDADNFHLMTGSPLIEQGTLSPPTPIILPSSDLDGGSRIWGSNPDIGAYEWRDDGGREYRSRIPDDGRERLLFSAGANADSLPVDVGDPGELRRGCDRGISLDCTNYARALRYGAGLTRDLVAAISSYGRACDGGNASACHELGQMHHEGLGTPASLQRARSAWKQALVLYQKDVEEGSADAADALATLRMLGIGGGSFRAKATNLWKLAATLRATACDKNDWSACNKLGVMRALGLGVTRDTQQALSLYRRACAKDHAAACVNAGWALEYGEGTDRCLGEAGSFYRKACKLGSAAGCKYFDSRPAWDKCPVNADAAALIPSLLE